MIEPFFVPSTDGVNVAVYDFGGDGPLLMFCHATGLCGGTWGQIAGQLVDQFHCVAIDFRAHGRSELPPGVSLEWQGMANDLLAAIDEVRRRGGERQGGGTVGGGTVGGGASGGGTVGPVFAVGHSMGGAAIVLADLMRPGTITKAWAFEPILFPEPGVPIPGLEDRAARSALPDGARRRRSDFESREVVRERYASRPPFNRVDPDVLQDYVDYGFKDVEAGGVRLRCEPEHEAQVFENHGTGAFDRLSDVEFPFLIAASGDGGPPAVIVPIAVSKNPAFVEAHYPDLTHFGPLEAPQQLAKDIAAWLSDPLDRV